MLAILLVVCGMGVILFRVIANRPKPAPPARPVQVSTTTARQGDMGIYVEALGAVTPVATVTVPTQVSGQLDESELCRRTDGSRGGSIGGN